MPREMAAASSLRADLDSVRPRVRVELATAVCPPTENAVDYSPIPPLKDIMVALRALSLASLLLCLLASGCVSSGASADIEPVDTYRDLVSSMRALGYEADSLSGTLNQGNPTPIATYRIRLKDGTQTELLAFAPADYRLLRGNANRVEGPTVGLNPDRPSAGRPSRTRPFRLFQRGDLVVLAPPRTGFARIELYADLEALLGKPKLGAQRRRGSGGIASS